MTSEGDQTAGQSDEVPPLHVRVMGVVVKIPVPDDETHDRLARQWSRALVADADAVATVPARQNGPEDEASRDYGLTTRVTMAALRATTGRRVNLHAGGVADDRGRLLALVAPSGMGKTTATRTLATHLGYVSDETVSIDPDGTVAPHPKPLSVLLEPGAKSTKRQLSPDELGLLPTPATPRLARLVVLDRGGDGPPGLAPLPTTAALLQLVEQSSSLSQLPRPLHTLLGLVRECGGAWALTYDEITDHVDALVGFLAGAPGPPVEGHRLVWHDREDTSPVDGDDDGPVLGRLPFAEAVEVDDELVVLTDSHAWLLAQLTKTIWLRLARPCSFEELVAAAEERHGVHERAGEIVRAAVTTLVGERLVRWGSLA